MHITNKQNKILKMIIDKEFTLFKKCSEYLI